MTLNLCSLSSGSSGNCYLIKSETTAILVDAGISGKRIVESLEKTGTDHNDVHSLLITHEHIDHTRSLTVLLKKNKNMKAYANEMTWMGINKDLNESQRRVFDTGKSFFVRDIEVKPFKISHDTLEPVGFSFYKSGKQISILTDTGCITESIFEEILNADLLVLEANHDVEMLKMGRYPWFLKKRVLGEEGHLSNVTAGETIRRLLQEKNKGRLILLGHLSKENNFPQMAYQTVKNILEEANYHIGKHVFIDTILRDELSYIYSI